MGIKKIKGVLHQIGHAHTSTPAQEAKYVGRVTTFKNKRGMLSKGGFRRQSYFLYRARKKEKKIAPARAFKV